MTNDGGNAPAGWYPSGDGSQRYWDGSQWTEHSAPMAMAGAPQQPGGVAVGGATTNDERTMAMLAHLLGVLSFLGPLIIYLVKKDESAFVKDQAGEALNFSISMAIYLTGYVIVSTILVFVIIGIFMFFLVPVFIIGIVVLHIIAGIAANKGEYYRYPLTLRLIK